MNLIIKISCFIFLLKGVCCRDFNISLPEKIQALSGSCVIIMCSFEIKEIFDKNLTETATGVWFKDGTDVKNNVVFSSSTSNQNSVIKGKITGKLKDKNCTTVFTDIRSTDSGRYFFRIEGEGGLKWTFTESSVSIDVIDFPDRPLVRVSVDGTALPDGQEVLEGSCVSVRCSAESLCSSPPPTLTWSSTPRIPLSERPQELISDLNFTADHTHHTLTVTCTITYQLQEHNATAHSNITLHVKYAPKIYSSSNCTIGNVIECFCEADGNPFPKVQWYLSGRPVSNSLHMLISEERLNSTGLRSFISLHQSLTHTSTLQCFTYNTHGSDQQLFYLVFTEKKWTDISFLLIGLIVGTSFIGFLWVTTVLFKRICTAQKDDETELIGTKGADSGNKQEESFYANKVMMSSAEAPTQHPPLHYSSVKFTNTKPQSKNIIGASSLTEEYATV